VVCEYMEKGSFSGCPNESTDGYLVYSPLSSLYRGVDVSKQKTGYAYYPRGKDLAEKFAGLCNDVGEKEACKVMGYREP